MGVHYNKADFITYGRPSLFLDFANKKSLTDRISGNNLITFTRTSTGTYVGADGLIKTATTNEARFDHNPTTLESLGLLIEEQRINLVTNSENMSTWGQTNVTVSGEVMNGPAGNISYSKVTLNTFTNNRGFISIGISNNPSTLYTTSTYLKAGTCRYVILTTNAFNSNNYGAYFDLQTGTMYNNRGAVAFNSVNVGNGWYRLSVVVDSLTGGSGRNVFIIPVPISNPTQGPSNNIDPYYDANGEYLYVWGAQCEQGSFTTSYIPTSGSQVTRNADSASITGSNFSSWYSQNAGTFCSITTMNVTENQGLYINSARTIYELAPNVSFTGIENSTLTSRGWTMRSNYGSPSYEIFDNYSKTGTHKMASYFSSSGVGFSVDGRSIVSASVSNPTSLNSSTIYIGNAPDGFGTYGYLNGTISRLTYYPTRLTNAQLQNLTR
jgi:hypothetical protein